jgi:hypothetical protein
MAFYYRAVDVTMSEINYLLMEVRHRPSPVFAVPPLDDITPLMVRF